MSTTPAGKSLAENPPMGWNSWNTFTGSVSDRVIRETADAIASNAMKELGYEYVVIDDLWQGGRDEKGFLYPDRERFPEGIKALADYVHGKGLKFGIYSCAGHLTCGNAPGSLNHEEQDAERFASWGVDFLKYDYCYAPDDYRAAVRRYTRMGKALKSTGRPILFSVCEWGPRAPWLWAGKAGGHMWRVSFDVVDCWDQPRNTSSGIGILTAIDAMAGLEGCSGPGGWNDPDMLVVGLNGKKSHGPWTGCTRAEYRTQMSMWCMLAAPLMAGCDLRTVDEDSLAIMSNRELIAVDQDSLGRQGYRVWRNGAHEVWKKPLTDGRMAVALLNRGESPAEIRAEWSALGIEPGQAMDVRDLWLHQDMGRSAEAVSGMVEPHGTQVFLLVPYYCKQGG